VRFDNLSAGARAVWAKSGDPIGHGLLTHMLDVAAVAERILAREPPGTVARTASAFGLPAASACRTIAAAVGLHDLGKAIPGFQNKWPQGRAADEAAGLALPAHTLAADLSRAGQRL
jgi:CRISPR-associated endonuclease/helicase Cas3